MSRPRIAMTLGDVAGIGPEVVAAACLDASVRSCCRPFVVGEPRILERALALLGASNRVRTIDSPQELRDGVDELCCWNPLGLEASRELTSLAPGALDARAGRAAYEWLLAAATAALGGSVDAIVTAPLNKAALHMAGVSEPGHTEILAQVCGVRSYAMMLFVPPGEIVRGPRGLGIAHVSLHTSLRSVPKQVTTAAVREKIGLLDVFLHRIGVADPRLAVCALNPHAGEGGLFGTEERDAIRPGVEQALSDGHRVEGPIAADALMRRALAGEFDGVVAMYHDQAHIPIKLVARESAVNVTLGLPIVRTSPTHGTAFDIAWQGKASPRGMVEAVRLASILARTPSVVASTS